MKRILSVMLAMISLCMGLIGCSAPKKISPYQKTNIAMGTMVTQALYVTGNDSKEAPDIAMQIDELLLKLEAEELSYRLSESAIYKLNKALENGEKPNMTEMVKNHITDYIRASLEVAEKSEGALDISLGKVVSLWNIDTYCENGGVGFMIPSKEALDEALANTGMDKIHVNGEEIVFDAPCALDLGAVGKGIALDRIRGLLDDSDKSDSLAAKSGVFAAIIQVGGSVLTYGTKPDGQPFRVAIVNPRDTGKQIGYLSLEGQWCVSTSGDYERYVEKDGVRYHHILDPKTGYPVNNELCSVTIVARSGFLTDALSTACFVLGTDKGMTLAQEYDAEALFVNKDGQITMTEGMKKIFTEQK